MSVSAKEQLIAKFSNLREGDHSWETAGMIAEQIRQGVENGEISWEELGTSSAELDRLLKRFVHGEYNAIVTEYKKLWQEYVTARENGDSVSVGKVLFRLKPVFAQIRTLIQQHMIEPQALMPCNYFELQEALKEVGS